MARAAGAALSANTTKPAAYVQVNRSRKERSVNNQAGPTRRQRIDESADRNDYDNRLGSIIYKTCVNENVRQVIHIADVIAEGVSKGGQFLELPPRAAARFPRGADLAPHAAVRDPCIFHGAPRADV
jgi:hypothetical protein